MGRLRRAAGAQVKKIFTPRRRNIASRSIQHWKRKLSKDANLLARLTSDDNTTDDFQLKLFRESIRNACKQFGLNSTKSAHLFVLLGILSNAYFGPPSALSGGAKKRGRPDINKELLAYHSLRLDQMIRRRGTQFITSALKDKSIYDSKPYDGKFTNTKRAEVIQFLWPEDYDKFTVEAIAKKLGSKKSA